MQDHLQEQYSVQRFDIVLAITKFNFGIGMRHFHLCCYQNQHFPSCRTRIVRVAPMRKDFVSRSQNHPGSVI